MGASDIVAPACCTFTNFQDNLGLQRLLIKGCDYSIDQVGLVPKDDLDQYAKNRVFIGYLSPTDYHRFHAPIAGTCIHCALDDEDALSASVKFFGGRFNLLNQNKRLIVVLETKEGVRVALVIVGGVGVNTIVFDKSKLLNQWIDKGAELGTFRAGGSAFAMFSNREIELDSKIVDATSTEEQRPIEVQVGESLANFKK